jgi:hypothetical protein
MDEELKRFLDDAAEQRARVRENLMGKQEPKVWIDEMQYNSKAWDALRALRERQNLESLGRWVISKCLIAGVKFK